jgi:hypothetical protein
MQDVFVGLITCLAGVWFVIGAASDHQFLFDLQKIRLLIALFGRQGSRIALAILGVGLIAIGALICSGWRLRLFE